MIWKGEHSGICIEKFVLAPNGKFSMRESFKHIELEKTQVLRYFFI